MRPIYRNLFAVVLGIVTASVQAETQPVRSMPIPQIPGLGPGAPARCLKWDYFLNPVDTQGSGVVHWAYGTEAVFDGYPADVSLPEIRTIWNCDAPTADVPVFATIDYKRPVAVTKFVHFYNRTDGFKAWKDVEILTSNDGEIWTPRQTLTNLQRDLPQVLGIDSPVEARFYKVVIQSLSDESPKMGTYELQTFYGASVGNVTADADVATQSEPHFLAVRVVSPDVTLKGATIRLVAPAGSLDGPLEIDVAEVSSDTGATIPVQITPLRSGVIPMFIELHAGGFLIDKRPYNLRVKPKLSLTQVTPEAVVYAKVGDPIVAKGKVTNVGQKPAMGVNVSWMGQSKTIGDLPPGHSAAFELTATAAAGYNEGVIDVAAAGQTKTILRRGVICPSGKQFNIPAAKVNTIWKSEHDVMKYSSQLNAGDAILSGSLAVFSSAGAIIPLIPIAQDNDASPAAAAQVPGGVLVARFGVDDKRKNDPQVSFEVIPDDPHPLAPAASKFNLKVMVDQPRKLFRPHISLFDIDPSVPCPSGTGGYAHLFPTRMMCLQTDVGTVSVVPDHDNMICGYSSDYGMVCELDIDLAAPEDLGQKTWQPITKGPMKFGLTLPMRTGDWWDAYRYVAGDLFQFHQARQWAMPITQMQMLTTRHLMRPENWSEIFNTLRSFPRADVFYNFYGTTYSVPALYSWYLATDDENAKVKTERIVDWLINQQVQNGPMAGAWYSQYIGSGNPPAYYFKGTDQAGNPWLQPHSTGTAAKTLLWYWQASDKTNDRAFAAAKRACDLLISKQRADGSWSYAYDADGKQLREFADAGQIWCMWALWKMHEFTGDENYKTAAMQFKDYFVKTYFEPHIYKGYWEDVSAGSEEISRSRETYEAAIASMAFAEMGDSKLAQEIAKDAAVATWTRVITTRQYETAYGMTIEQGSGGPSQAQSPLVGSAMQRIYEMTGDPFWSDLSGCIKAINFCADADQGYGMCAIAGWDESLTGAFGPHYDNVRPVGKPGGAGRGVWTEWQTSQFAWFALDWLVREACIRAPQYLKIDPTTMRGTVLGQPGRIKMPEERCDVTGMDHIDINWVGMQNDRQYALVVMNHQEPCVVAIRPHEAHLDIPTVAPRLLIGGGETYREMPVEKKGAQYFLQIPEKSTAILIWERIQ